MTPVFWLMAAIVAGVRAALAASWPRLVRAHSRASQVLRARRRAKVVIVAQEYLPEYTGLTRAELDQVFKAPHRKRGAPCRSAARSHG